MKQTIIAISGYKNSGKTTLIEAMLPHITGAGIKTAVIKHDGHSFSPDVPGTDTCRFLNAGADATVVFDGEKYMLVKKEQTEIEALIKLFPDYPLILIEGMKHMDVKKLFISDGMVESNFADVKCSRDEVQRLATLIVAEVNKNKEL